MLRSGPPPPPAGGSIADFEVRTAWRRDDSRIEADAIEFWTRLGLLLPGVRPQDRAKERIAAAYRDGRLAAIATATLDWIPKLRARFAIVRGATDPDYRRSHAQLALADPDEKLAGASPSSSAASGAISPGCRSGPNRS